MTEEASALPRRPSSQCAVVRFTVLRCPYGGEGSSEVSREGRMSGRLSTMAGTRILRSAPARSTACEQSVTSERKVHVKRSSGHAGIHSICDRHRSTICFRARGVSRGSWDFRRPKRGALEAPSERAPTPAPARLGSFLNPLHARRVNARSGSNQTARQRRTFFASRSFPQPRTTPLRRLRNGRTPRTARSTSCRTSHRDDLAAAHSCTRPIRTGGLCRRRLGLGVV